MAHPLVDGLREGLAEGPPLRVEGSVGFVVDGPRGSTRGVVAGDGPVVRVTTDDPVAAWAAASDGAPAGPRALGDLADLLSAAGVSVELSGPGGRVATVGAGVESALGRVVTGSRHVQPGGAAAVGPLVVAQARQLAAARRPLLVAAAVVLVLLRARSRRS